MKKIQMLISFLVFLLFTSNQVIAVCSPKAKDIPMYKKGAHLGARTTKPGVTASLEKGQLMISVTRYTGIVNVEIYNDTGSLVTTTSLFVDGKGQCTLDLATLDGGSYEASVELSNVIYVGTFEF